MPDNSYNRRTFLIGTGATVFAGSIISPFAAAAESKAVADIIYRNGRVWTGMASAPWTDAIAVSASHVVALGEAASRAAASNSTRIVDLGGAMVVPGMMDTHTHFVMGSRMLTQVDLLAVKPATISRLRWKKAPLHSPPASGSKASGGMNSAGAANCRTARGSTR